MTTQAILPAHDVTDLGLAAEGVRRIEWAPSDIFVRQLSLTRASLSTRTAQSRREVNIVRRSAVLGSSPLTHRIRFLLEMPIATLFDFLL